MRLRFILSAAAAALLLAALGCGGDSGSGGGNKGITGIWSGRTTNTTSGSTRNAYVQYTQAGNTLSGNSFLDDSGIIITGTSTGTITGNTATVTIDYGSVFGTAVVNYTITGNQLTGTYSLTANGQVTETGTISLTRSSPTATVNTAASYAGTTLQTGGNTSKPLSFTIAQNGNQLTITNGSSNGNPFTGTGAAIGDNIGGVLTITGGTDTIDIFGTVSGSTITGSYWEPGTDSGNNGTAQTGTFTVTTAMSK